MPDLSPNTSQSSLELLYHLSRELSTGLDLDLILQRILSLAIENVKAERGSIVVLDDQGVPVEGAILVGNRIIDHTAQQLRETIERGLAGWVLRNMQPALVTNTHQDVRWLRRQDDAHNQSGAKSAICVPLMAREHLVGVVTIVHSQPGFFTNEHLSLVQSIADMAGVAVMNARLYEESQRQARVMTALAENVFSLNSSLRLDKVLQNILDKTAHAMQAEDVLLGMINEATHDLTFRAATGKSAQILLGYRLPIGQGVAGRVAKTGRGVVIPNITSSSEAQLPGLEVKSLVCAPVNLKGKVIGVLQAINPPSKHLDSEALLVLTGLGSLAGVAIHNAQLYEELDSAHQRYRILFDGSIDPIIISDLKGKISEVNHQTVQFTGYDPKVLIGQNMSFLHQINLEKVGDSFSKISKTGSAFYESDLTASGGKIIPVEVYVQSIAINGENYLQWILRDNTERKKLAEMQDDLISMVYHDLRSPLANVISSLELLESMNLVKDEEALSLLSIATNSTTRMQRLVNSLLDVRRIEAGQELTKREKYSPYGLVKDAVDAASFITNGKRLQVLVNLPTGLPEVMVDVDMIRRVLVNLIENACKFTPPEGKIQIGAIRVGPWIQMWVKDSGPGIPLGDQERIFDKFVRLQTPGAPKGLGLGLAFCKLAINAHHGKIWVMSQPPNGSQFLFTLPVADSKENA